MKGNKFTYGIIEIIILVMIALLSFTVLNMEYLFGWVAHNWKFYLLLSAVALLLLLLDKGIVSRFMTTGIVIGIFVGNFFGKTLKTINEGKITEGMAAEEIYRLRHHPGFEIWMGVIFLFIVLGIIIQITVKKSTYSKD